MVARIIFLLLLSPWIGTWKLNPAKSTSAPDRYKRVITKIQPWNDSVKVSYDMVGVRGGVSHLEWVGKFDGKDYRVSGADYLMTNAYTQLDERSYQIVVKVEGAVAATAHVEISPDGKTLTTVTTEKDSHGNSIMTTAVYEKVS